MLSFQLPEPGPDPVDPTDDSRVPSYARVLGANARSLWEWWLSNLSNGEEIDVAGLKYIAVPVSSQPPGAIPTGGLDYLFGTPATSIKRSECREKVMVYVNDPDLQEIVRFMPAALRGDAALLAMNLIHSPPLIDKDRVLRTLKNKLPSELADLIKRVGISVEEVVSKVESSTGPDFDSLSSYLLSFLGSVCQSVLYHDYPPTAVALSFSKHMLLLEDHMKRIRNYYLLPEDMSLPDREKLYGEFFLSALRHHLHHYLKLTKRFVTLDMDINPQP